jgi:LysR family transcriptional regulator, regulator for metE and metH
VIRIGTPKPKLDVRDLELILAVAGSGSTVKAASSLHVTQSAVSRGLILAEEKLGMRLFERTARGLAPTAAGARLIGGAGPVLAQLVELERYAETPTSEPLRVRLVCECYTAYRWLPSTLASLRRTLPSLDVTLALEHTHDPVAGLLAGDIDIALLTTAPVRGVLEELPLFSDEIVFVVAKTHPLAARASLTRADLRETPLITSSQTPKAEARWFHERVFGRAKPKLEWVLLPLTEAIMDAARAGMGIAILSEWIAGPYVESGDLVVKRLGGRELRRRWRIAFRREAKGTATCLAAALDGAAPRMYHART